MSILNNNSRTIGGGGSFSSAFDSFSSRPNNAPITRPVVPLPNRSDFGGGVTAERIAGPNRRDFGSANGTAMTRLGRDTSAFRSEYNNPTNSGAFRDLMSLSNEQTGAQQSEVARQSRDAASRAGFTGGFSSREREASRDRMSALAETGFAGAGQIRSDALKGYTAASGAFAQAAGDYNRSNTESNVAFANAAQGTRETNAKLGLGASEINQRAQDSWASAKSEHQKLQSQLDSQFNNQLIDKGRYEQMSRSLEAQLMMEQNRLTEQARQFDLGLSDTRSARDAAERQALAERDSKAAMQAAADAAATGRTGMGEAGATERARLQAELDRAKLSAQRQQFDRTTPATVPAGFNGNGPKGGFNAGYSSVDAYPH